MDYGRRNNSVLDTFSLSPLPYPVLLILTVISIFFGISWYLSYEEILENAEQNMGWALFATPVVLLILARWLSSVEPEGLFGTAASPWDHRRWSYNLSSEGGSSPWGVAALIVLLLVLVQFHDTFRESWLI